MNLLFTIYEWKGMEKKAPPPSPSPSSPYGGLRGDKSVLLPLALLQGRGRGWLLLRSEVKRTDVASE